MQHLPTDITVDHINRDGLYNCKTNLRLVDKTIQIINQGMRENNKSGMTGVFFDKKWRDGGHCCRYSSKKYADARTRAIEHRQKMMRELPRYNEALCLDDPQA